MRSVDFPKPLPNKEVRNFSPIKPVLPVMKIFIWKSAKEKLNN